MTEAENSSLLRRIHAYCVHIAGSHACPNNGSVLFLFKYHIEVSLSASLGACKYRR